MKAIEKRGKEFLLRALAALAILTLCIGPALTSPPVYADDGAAVAAVAAPAVEATAVEATATEAAPAVETTDVEATATEAVEAAPAVETADVEATATEAVEAAPAVETTDVEATATEAVETTDVEATATEAVETTDVEATATEAAPAVETADVEATATEAAPAVETADVEATATEAAPAVETADVETADVEAADVETADVETTDVEATAAEAAPVADAPAVDTASTETANSASIGTDRLDYNPGDTATIAGQGFAPNSEVTVNLTNPNGAVTQWTVTADESGALNTSYELVDGIKGFYNLEMTDGTNTASTLFTDPIMILLPNSTTYPSAPYNPLKGSEPHHAQIDDNEGGTGGNDGDSTYVYNDGANAFDVYGLTDPPDTTAPNAPAPTSTTPTGVWTNNPNVTVSWNGVTDPSGESINNVYASTVAKVVSGVDPNDKGVIGLVIPDYPGYYGPAWFPLTSTSYDIYSTSGYANNPATGQPWTWQDLQNLSIVVGLGESGTSMSRCTQAYVTVDYNAPGPSYGVDEYTWEFNNPNPNANTVDHTGSGPYSVTQTLPEGINTFYIFSKDNAGLNSTTSQLGTFLIDQTEPWVNKGVPPPDGQNGWYVSDFELTFTAGDNIPDGLTEAEVSGLDWVRVWVDGTRTQYDQGVPPDTDPTNNLEFTVQISKEGTTEVEYRGKDIAGNKTAGRSETTQYYNLDKTDPRLYKDLDGTEGNYGWYTSDVEVSLWATDWSLYHETSGIKYIQYQVGDGGTVVQVPIPAEQPTTQGPIAYPTPDTGGEWLLYLAKMAGGVAPDEGWFPLNDETVEILITQEGKTTLYHTAQDVAGNANDPAGTVDYEDLGWAEYRVGDQQEIKIDKTAPQLYKLEFGQRGDNDWYTSPVEVKLIATDPNSGSWRNPVQSSGVDYITYKIDGDGWVTCDAPMGGWFRDDDQGPQLWICPDNLFGTFTVDGEGYHTLYHEAYDVAGNIHEKQGGLDVGYEQEIKIDQLPPELFKDLSGTVGNNGWFRSPVLVTLTATDATSGVQYIKYSTDGGTNWTTVQSDTTNFTLNNEGTTSLGHETKDMAGHTFVLAPQDVNIDWTEPTLVKDAARTGANEITVTLTGADATSGVDFIRYSTDGGTNWTTVNSNTTTFTLTGIGDHNLGHLVFDIAGNEYVLADQILTIDGPAITLTSDVTAITVTVDVLGTVASFPISIDGVLLEDIEITSPDGVLTLRIPAGTIILGADGTPASNIQILADEGFTAPDGYQMVAAYQLVPSGMTFAPDATLIVNYDPATLPEGTTPVLAYFDETTGAWVEVETAGYVAGGVVIPNTIISQLGGAHTFAILAH